MRLKISKFHVNLQRDIFFMECAIKSILMF